MWKAVFFFSRLQQISLFPSALPIVMEYVFACEIPISETTV